MPEEIICIIKDIYTHSMITVAHGNANTELIQVDRGVLQGDPCSPLIFNICFNPLMQTVIQSKYLHLGYMWGPNADLRSRSWLQFADDTVLISDNIKSAQSLLNLNAAWCEWAEMKIRIDKCSTFGMRKQSGSYIQFQPKLTIGDSSIPPLDDGEQFKYLGRMYDFSMKNEYIKADLEQRLTSLLQTTSDLDIKPQQKLKILKIFIPSRLTFDLRIYDISYTWIMQTLDSKISNAVRDWMEFPISTCVSEILSLPANHGGLGIPSLKDTAEKLRLGQRFKLHSSSDKELQVLFETTSDQNVRTDSIILTNSSRNEAIREVKATHIQASFDHIVSLKVQGRSISSIIENLSKTAISRWTRELDKLAAPLFNFVRKALVQQLPTAANLVRWGKSQDPLCLLCKNASQTNKHVLSNCFAALDRYTKRHDAVLRILANWILNNTKPDREIFVDLSIGTHGSLSNLFHSLRPDVAILSANSVDTLELTVCHETNLANSKQYKSLKYADIRSDIKESYSNFKIKNYTIEVTTLRLISDTKQFCHDNLTNSFPVEILNQVTQTAISNSFEIYCNRNIKQDS